MSLQLWIPLNGTTNNQGLSGITMTGSPNSWGAGNMGKCATFTGNISNVIYNTTSEFNYTDNFSWAVWIKTNYTGTTAQYAFTVGRADAGGYGYGLHCLNATTCRVRYGSGSWDVIVTGSTWTHIAVTKSGSTIKIYKNGSLNSTNTFSGTTPTYADANGIGIGCFHYTSNIYPFYGSLCDFRIYDNCLSPREVKEISKGLYCHYALKNSDYARNYFTNAIAKTNVSKQANATVSYSEYDRTYTITPTAINSSAWGNGMCFTGTVLQLPYGKRAIVSFEAWSDIVATMNFDINNYPVSGSAWSGNDNDLTSSRITSSKSLPANTWTKMYFTYVNEHASNTNRVALYDNSTICVVMQSEDKLSPFKVRNIKYEIVDKSITTPSPWCPSWSDTDTFFGTEHDLSGYGNHGQITSSAYPTWASDSPRYQGSYVFNGSSSYIDCGNSFMCQGQTALTISLWAYSDNWTTFGRLYSCTESGGFNTEYNSSNSNMYFALNVYSNSDKTTHAYVSKIGDGSGYLKIPCSALSTGWHLFIFKYDMNSGTSVYLDGNLYSKSSFTSYGIYYNTSVYLYLGCEAGSSSASSPYFVGKLSDFRIYGTALSDADIQELYNAPITITDSGAIMTQGEFIEE